MLSMVGPEPFLEIALRLEHRRLDRRWSATSHNDYDSFLAEPKVSDILGLSIIRMPMKVQSQQARMNTIAFPESPNGAIKEITKPTAPTANTATVSVVHHMM